jgi:hypothetical protein
LSKKKLGGIIAVCVIAVVVVVVIATRPTTMYILNVSVSPSGAGSISPLGGEYESGVEVTVTASPASGYRFVNWTGDVDTVADVNAATTSITMNNHYSITANLALETLEIRDWYDMHAVRDDLGGDYLLMNDLDSTTPGYEELASPTANGGKGWEPIGSLGTRLGGPFFGSFDGQRYEIRDLFIDRPDENRVGLFGVVSDEGVIQNIGLMNLAVTGNEYVGGLAGENLNGTVQDSYSNGNVVGDWHIGGLVGWNWGSVINSYAADSVSGSGYGGGLVGDNSGTVSNSYSTGSLTVRSYVGGLIGSNSGTVSNSYYNYEEVLMNGEHIITIGALSDEDFEQWLADDKSFDINDRLPQENGYYVITNVNGFKELLAFGQDDSLRFRLKSDLDLGTAANFYIPYLSGEFDGNRHKISGLNLDFDSVSAVGLFGYLAPGGEVTRLAVENANITGNLSIGGIVGLNYGIVSNSCFAGTITGEDYVGGLAAFSWGTVSSCYSTGSVTGNQYIGGLVGLNEGTVNDSYCTGSVIGNRAIGGLLGYNREGTVSMCYAAGSVTSGGACHAGLVCWNGGTVYSSFWDTESTRQPTSNGGTGKTTAEMKRIATFSDTATDGLDESWDITPVVAGENNAAYTWNIVDGETYPFLSWQYVS